MKKNLKKGFTLTELVVVIVIIGILAAVLIPTLTSYITRSRKSAAEQEASAHLQELSAYVLEASNDDWFELNEYIKAGTVAVKSGDFWVFFKEGQLQLDKTSKTAPTSSTADAKLEFSTGLYELSVLDDTAMGNFEGSAHLTEKVSAKYIKVTVAGETVTVTPADAIPSE